MRWLLKKPDRSVRYENAEALRDQIDGILGGDEAISRLLNEKTLDGSLVWQETFPDSGNWIACFGGKYVIHASKKGIAMHVQLELMRDGGDVVIWKSLIANFEPRPKQPDTEELRLARISEAYVALKKVGDENPSNIKQNGV